MATADMIRPFVAQAVARAQGVDQITPDGDGDLPVPHGSSVTFVRVLDGPVGPIVRFFSPLIADVERSTTLLERLNALNISIPYVQFCWFGNQVVCSLDLDGANLQPEEIDKALDAVVSHSNELDEPLQKEFGGRRMIDPASSAKPPTEAPAELEGYRIPPGMSERLRSR